MERARSRERRAKGLLTPWRQVAGSHGGGANRAAVRAAQIDDRAGLAPRRAPRECSQTVGIDLPMKALVWTRIDYSVFRRATTPSTRKHKRPLLTATVPSKISEPCHPRQP